MKEKDIIFLDTSIFEANNFLEGNRIKEILKLSEEGVIKIVIPKLTYDEILNRIKKNIEAAYPKFMKCRSDVKILRNIPSIKNIFNDIAEKEKLIEELKEVVHQKFISAKIIIIDYSEIDIREIFENYFNKKFPFSQSKKCEFPDAFALKTLENWSKEKQVNVKVFSKDNDINNYESENFIIDEEFEDYLNRKLSEIAKKKKLLQNINNAIEEYKTEIIEEIKQWTINSIDDISLYYEHTNFYEIHDLSINEINVELENFQITSIDDESVTIEIEAKIYFKVDLLIDDENYMIKDYDTNEWIFLETTYKEIEGVINTTVNVILYTDDNEIIEFDIEEINGGNRLEKINVL